MTNPYQPPEQDFPDDNVPYHGEHDDPDYDEAREYWPTCPDCGKRLTITCPFCKTTDDLFPLGDTEYWDDDLGGSLVEYQHRLDRKVASRSVLFGEGDTSMPLDEHGCSRHKMGKMPNELYGGTQPELTGGHSCHNRNHDCDCDKNDDEYDETGYDWEEAWQEEPPEREYDSESLPFVVICPTCSEAFIPSFPGGCRHCHYVWDRSKPMDAEQAVDAHRQSPRQVANPALAEPTGLSLIQLAVMMAVLLIVLIVVAKLLF